MDTIYSLLKRAKELKEKSQVDSITPEEVGKLHEDTLAYIASLEQSADGLGIKKVYQSKSAMEADTDPVGTNGKTLRYGQLVSIYDDAHADCSENGNIYAYQKPGWLLMGKVSGGAGFSIAQEAGDSVAAVMSQAAVTKIISQYAATAQGKTLQDIANTLYGGDTTLQYNGNWIDRVIDSSNTLVYNQGSQYFASQPIKVPAGFFVKVNSNGNRIYNGIGIASEETVQNGSPVTPVGILDAEKK